MASCSILQIELYADDKQVDGVHMMLEEVAQMGEQAVQELCNRASNAVAPRQVNCLTYDDDEGDSCTLTKDTLPDALSFATPLDESVGVLRLHVKCAPEAKVEEPVASAPEPQARTETFEAAALAAINKLAQGLDLRSLVPKLAEVALNIVATVEEPALFVILDILTAFQEGTRTAEDLPNALPEIIAVLCSLPEETRVSLLAQARMAAEKVVEELKEMPPTNVPVEVHVGVCCDGCNCAPIVGPRYKSLEQDDFDLCATCFGREARQPHAWVQIKSDVQADVVSSYFASPDTSPVHHGVVCDECGMGPIVGQRFKARGEDFDLCACCMGTWKTGPKAGTKTFEEITITTAAKVVTTEQERTGNESVHHGVECDGCQMYPIVGARFKACGENFDFCGACMESWNVGSQFGTKMFEEVCLPALAPSPPTEVPEEVPEEEAPESFLYSQGEDMLPSLTESECREAIMALLQHSNAEVRDAVNKALVEAKGAVEDEVTKVLPFVPPPREVLNHDVFPTDQIDTDATEEDEEVCVDEEIVEKPKISAKVLTSAELVLGIEAYEDATARGDVTAQLADIVASCGATHAYSVGRVILTQVEDDTLMVPACAKIVVINDGEAPWPETAAISIACGPHYDFPHMELGGLQVGEAAEVVMDLAVPASTYSPTRSVWAITDTATGALLGPILCFDVVHE